MSKKRVSENGQIDYDLDFHEDPSETAAIMLADVLRLLAYAEDTAPQATAQQRLYAAASMILANAPNGAFMTGVAQRLLRPAFSKPPKPDKKAELKERMRAKGFRVVDANSP